MSAGLPSGDISHPQESNSELWQNYILDGITKCSKLLGNNEPQVGSLLTEVAQGTPEGYTYDEFDARHDFIVQGSQGKYDVHLWIEDPKILNTAIRIEIYELDSSTGEYEAGEFLAVDIGFKEDLSISEANFSYNGDEQKAFSLS